MTVKDIIIQIVYNNYQFHMNRGSRIELHCLPNERSCDNFPANSYMQSIKNKVKELRKTVILLKMFYDGNPKVLLFIDEKSVPQYKDKAHFILLRLIDDFHKLHTHKNRIVGTKNYIIFSFVGTVLFDKISVHTGVIIKLIEDPDDIDWLFKDRNSLFENI